MGIQVWLERKQVWWVQLGDNRTNKNSEFYTELHYINYQQSFCARILKFGHVMKGAVSLKVSFDVMDLISIFCRKLMLIMEIPCTIQKSDGFVVGRCWNDFLFPEIRNKVASELSHENWLYVLALLCDISHCLNDWNTELQRQQKLISVTFWVAKAFQMKLKLFRKQL